MILYGALWDILKMKNILKHILVVWYTAQDNIEECIQYAYIFEWKLIALLTEFYFFSGSTYCLHAEAHRWIQKHLLYIPHVTFLSQNTIYLSSWWMEMNQVVTSALIWCSQSTWITQNITFSTFMNLFSQIKI